MRFINLAHVKASNFIHGLKADAKGASMVEYSILIGIITAAAIASIVFTGGRVTTYWSNLTSILP